MRTRNFLAAVIATAALALTACSSPDSTSRAKADPNAVEAASGEGSEEPSSEPTVSSAMVERKRAPKTPSLQVVRGIDRYDVNTGDNIDGALNNLLTDKANTFLRDHYLRRDRWAGKWYFKEGEIDAYREKVTPELFAEVEEALLEIHAATQEHGPDSEKWPKKVLKAAGKRTASFNNLFFNNDTSTGEGDIIYRSTERHLFRASAENNWERRLVGAPVTYAYFDVSHEVGSDGPMRFGVWQAWKKVKGDWRVLDAGWRYYE